MIIIIGMLNDDNNVDSGENDDNDDKIDFSSTTKNKPNVVCFPHGYLVDILIHPIKFPKCCNGLRDTLRIIGHLFLQ